MTLLVQFSVTCSQYYLEVTPLDSERIRDVGGIFT